MFVKRRRAYLSQRRMAVSKSEKFVFIFRDGRKMLSPLEQNARTEEVRDWALSRMKQDRTFDPRVLDDVRQSVGDDAANIAHPVIALNFLEAPTFDDAIEMAKTHPGLRYGVSIEVRPWRNPQAK
jgi:hypothetical protein